MEEWKKQVTYNYNPPYISYVYSGMYQSEAEQKDGNLPAWGENGESDCSEGAPRNPCTAAASIATMNEAESPLSNPGTGIVMGNYQSSELVYTDGTQAAPIAEGYGNGGSEVNRARKSSVSDTEPHTSPDSWSSVSSREGSLPMMDPATWVENAVKEEPVIRTVDGGEDVSSSLNEDSRNVATVGIRASDNSAPAPLPSPKMSCIKPAANPKVKVRTAFTASQMNALVQRFSVQRYLAPAEMKNLSEMTGLTYKQVKTWFQNRRMKLRRHQKDTSWVSERYAVHKYASPYRPAMSSMAPHIPPQFQGDGWPQFRVNYHQHTMETAFETPPNMSYYLASVSGAAGSIGFPPWPPNASQATVPNQPSNARWSVPQGGGPFDYSPNPFNPNNYMHAANFESNEGEAANSPLNPAAMHHGNH